DALNALIQGGPNSVFHAPSNVYCQMSLDNSKLDQILLDNVNLEQLKEFYRQMPDKIQSVCEKENDIGTNINTLISTLSAYDLAFPSHPKNVKHIHQLDKEDIMLRVYYFVNVNTELNTIICITSKYSLYEPVIQMGDYNATDIDVLCNNFFFLKKVTDHASNCVIV
ncbi:MAG: hypothetical protein Satyrvirus5_33, partial [Satyrvirus sp.]